ncbi:MAG: TlpA family protein disulfide reductase [Dehalococcoidia bacterium]|nr:TlpA family protein disulfide reductase [Dehalococcoidia bacterium]
MNNPLRITLIVTLTLMLSVGMAITGCSSNSASSTQGTQGTKVGDLAPDFQLDNLEGVSVSLSDFRGNPVMLNFWAIWCGPCVHEMPDIQSMYEEQSVKGLVLLAVNMGSTSSQVNEFLQNHDLFLPVLLDINREVAQAYGIRAIPTTFFIDEEGIIQVVKVGAFPNKEAIENDLDKIMS